MKFYKTLILTTVICFFCINETYTQDNQNLNEYSLELIPADEKNPSYLVLKKGRIHIDTLAGLAFNRLVDYRIESLSKISYIVADKMWGYSFRKQYKTSDDIWLIEKSIFFGMDPYRFSGLGPIPGRDFPEGPTDYRLQDADTVVKIYQGNTTLVDLKAYEDAQREFQKKLNSGETEGK